MRSRDGEVCLCKDYTGKPLWVRRLVTRRVLKHEYRVLTRLNDLSETPSAISLDNPDILMMEYMDHALPLPDQRTCEAGSYPPIGFFHHLTRSVTAMHAHGVAHGDLRRKNILYRPNSESPVLIDFATACTVPSSGSFLRRRLFDLMARMDLVTVLKIQASYYPSSLNADQRALLEDVPWCLRVGRFFRKNIYRRWLKRRKWRRRLDRWHQRRPESATSHARH